MKHSSLTRRAPLAALEFAAAPFALPTAIRDWSGRVHTRVRQRTALGALDERLLADIGVSREAARREAGKPFWKP